MVFVTKRGGLQGQGGLCGNSVSSTILSRRPRPSGGVSTPILSVGFYGALPSSDACNVHDDRTHLLALAALCSELAGCEHRRVFSGLVAAHTMLCIFVAHFAMEMC